MDTRTLLLITTFQSLNLATADWDPNNPLVVVARSEYQKCQAKRFPSVVRLENFEHSTCEVYYERGEHKIYTTFEYCPAPHLASMNCPEDNLEKYKYCNYSQYFYNERNHLTTRCHFQVDYELIKKTDSRGVHEPCFHNGTRAFLYSFVYWLCEFNNLRKKMKIYEVCYQEDAMRMRFGRYTIKTPNLLRNSILTSEQTYEFQFDTSHHYDPYTERIQIALHNLYIQNNTIYFPIPVLPHQWLPFALQRKTLFNYMNSGSINWLLKEVWETTMNNLKSRLSLMSEPVNVIAGLLDEIPDENPMNQFLGMFDYIWECPHPKFFWVLIYNNQNTEGVVIMMDNEPHQHEEYFYDRDRCNLEVCSNANLTDSIPQSPNIYCCQPIVITKKFELEGGNGLLEFPNP